MNKTKISAEVVADSVDVRGNRLTSLLITFPRIILAEINTHRMLSKNTSSSRAIPFHKMVESVQNDPFVPIAWQKEHIGMQGTEYITSKDHLDIIQQDWLRVRDTAVSLANALDSGFEDELSENGKRVDRVTKQLCNRLLEPFMWTTMLITGSKEGWDNFFELRCPSYQLGENFYKSKKDWKKSLEQSLNIENSDDKTLLFWLRMNKGQAEIHMMMLSEKIYDCIQESVPKQLERGQWHIPFAIEITDLYIKNKGYVPDTEIPINEFVKISTAMAAHTSYTTVGNEPVKSYEKWIELHDKLIAYDPPHSSPMEHCARAMSDSEYFNFVKGNTTDAPNNSIYGWCRNFKGFIPYRHIIETQNE